MDGKTGDRSPVLRGEVGYWTFVDGKIGDRSPVSI